MCPKGNLGGLKLSSIWLASRSPTVTGRPRRASEGFGPRARPGINGLLGFQGWLGTLPSAHTLKVAIYKATKEEGVKEVMAKDFKVFPLIFGLHVSGYIVEPVPEKRKIKLTAIVLCISTCLGIQGYIFLGL